MPRVRALIPCLTTFLAVASFVTAQAPPREVTDRLDHALNALKGGSFQGTYTMTVKSTVSKLDGTDPEQSSQLLEVVQPATGDPMTRVVHAEEGGKDVTAKRQREVEEQQRKEKAKSARDGDKSSDSISVTASLPAGEEVTRFEFSPPAREGELLVASFEPRPEHREREGITTGKLAWREDTLEPVWIAARPVKLPKHASELSMRFELGRDGELVYLHRLLTDGAGGMLWIKRRIHAEMEISEVRPAR
jgi:hypothetical protein